MSIAVSFDPADDADVEFIRNMILGNVEVEEAPAPKKAAPKKAALGAAAPEPEPEADEDEGPTLEQAIEKATELVSEGRAAEVKGALKELGISKKVSELEGDEIAQFLEAVSGDSVV